MASMRHVKLQVSDASLTGLVGCAVKVVTGGSVISGAFLLNKIS